MILLILFEIAVGVLLLTNPEAFTNAVIIIFGAVCVVIGFTGTVFHNRVAVDHHVLYLYRDHVRSDYACLGFDQNSELHHQ